MSAAMSISNALSTEVAPQRSDWLTVAEAAERIGCGVRHVRRLCLQWHPGGLARQEEGQWLVHVNATAGLLPTADPSADPEFLALPHHVRTRALQQAQCVVALRHSRQEPGAIKHREGVLIAGLRHRFPDLKISRRSLYRWDSATGSPIDPMELVDARKLTRTGAGDLAGVSPEAIAFFTEAYLEGRAPSIRVCHERTADFAAQHGYTWCASYHQAKRLKNRHIDRQTELQHRDHRKYQSTCEPWIERDPESFSANECWVSDHRPLDVICWVDDPDAKDGRRYFRPYLTVWQDWRTRHVLGWTLVESPNTASILAALKMALLNPLCAGPPRYAWIDNGRDFDSYTLQGMTKVQRRQAPSGREMLVEGEQTIFPGVFGLLHIEPHHAIPYRGQGKARCERLFATVAGRFDKTFPSYTGKDTARKPGDLSMHIDAGRAPHFNDVRDRLANWIEGHCQTVEHQMHDLAGASGKLSRRDAYAAWSTPAIMPDRQTLEMICYRWPAPPARKGQRQLGRTVGRNGVSVAIGGVTVRFGCNDDALRRFKATGRQVVVCYDPNNVEQLYVFDDKMSLVTIAKRNQQIGRYDDPMTETHLKAAARSQAAYVKAGEVRRQHREYEYLSTEEIAAQKARLAQQAKPIERQAQLNGNTRLVQTRIDEAVKAVQREQARKAAGAEHMIDDDLELPGGKLADLARLSRSTADDFDDDEPLRLSFDSNDSPATFADDDDTDVLDLSLAAPHDATDDDVAPHILDQLQ